MLFSQTPLKMELMHAIAFKCAGIFLLSHEMFDECWRRSTVLRVAYATIWCCSGRQAWKACVLNWREKGGIDSLY